MAPSLVPRRAHAFLLLALLMVAPLAGCLDKESDPIDPATGTDGTDGTDAQTGTGTDGTEEEAGDDLDKLKEQEKEGTTERVPAAHFHHYWGDPPLEDAYLFKGQVEMDQESCQPDRLDEQRPACIGAGERDLIEAHIGSVTFTPEDDGDDVPSNDGEDVRAIMDGKADSVLVGTNRMQVTISWEEPTVGELLFFYKPGNTNQFLPTQPEDYIKVQNGGTFTIPVSQNAADPAHQIAVSRWAFRLVADGGPEVQGQEWPFPVYHSEGTVDVEILIFNGGKEHIAPPHPDPWNGADMLRYETITGDFSTTQAKEQGIHDGAEDIMIPAIPKQPSIVPAGTAKLTVKAWVNASTDTQDTVQWGLKWHGADTVVYEAAPEPTAGDDGALVFEIPVDDVTVDPPYESESYFRFGFYPILGGEAEVGHYEADYTLIVTAHKDPEFLYYF